MLAIRIQKGFHTAWFSNEKRLETQQRVNQNLLVPPPVIACTSKCCATNLGESRVSPLFLNNFEAIDIDTTRCRHNPLAATSANETALRINGFRSDISGERQIITFHSEEVEIKICLTCETFLGDQSCNNGHVHDVLEV